MKSLKSSTTVLFRVGEKNSCIFHVVRLIYSAVVYCGVELQGYVLGHVPSIGAFCTSVNLLKAPLFLVVKSFSFTKRYCILNNIKFVFLMRHIIVLAVKTEKTIGINLFLFSICLATLSTCFNILF